jgi:dienelactone hydrolase
MRGIHDSPTPRNPAVCDTRRYINFLLLTCVIPISAMATEDLTRIEEARTDSYAATLEDYLSDVLVEQYGERASTAWQRDYTGEAEFVASVAPNRARWRGILNPLPLNASGPLERVPYGPLQEMGAQWLRLPLGGLAAEGLLIVPEGKGPFPLVIAQHGIGSYPEKMFGLNDPGNNYHAYGSELVAAGFAVLAPMNLRSMGRRNRVERLCRLADTTLPGIELARMQRLLDAVLVDERIDEDRVGMWGLSLGGLATMFWTPLEPRIKVGVVAGWFNHRRNKMVLTDKRYSCFLDTSEDHAFFRGWLTEFTDHDVVSLICPRPLLIQTGKKDGIAWWPMVEEEFAVARTHYEKLGIAERIELDLQDVGHEAHVESGLRFLTRWLVDAPTIAEVR